MSDSKARRTSVSSSGDRSDKFGAASRRLSFQSSKVSVSSSSSSSSSLSSSSQSPPSLSSLSSLSASSSSSSLPITSQVADENSSTAAAVEVVLAVSGEEGGGGGDGSGEGGLIENTDPESKRDDGDQSHEPQEEVETKMQKKSSKTRRKSQDISDVREVLFTMFQMSHVFGSQHKKVTMKAFFRWKMKIDMIKASEGMEARLEEELVMLEKTKGRSTPTFNSNESNSNNSDIDSSNNEPEFVISGAPDVKIATTDPSSISTVDEQPHKIDEHDDQRAVELWTKQQNLSDAYHNLKKQSAATELSLRRGGVAFTIMSFMRSRIKLKICRAFNRWTNFTNEKLSEKNLQQQKLKLDVGMKHIDSKQRTVKKIEVENDALKKSVLFNMMFNKWKLNNLSMKLEQERQEYETQKTKIMNEVLFLKELIRRNSQNEAHLVQISKENGAKYRSELEKLRNNLVAAYELLHKQKQMAEDLEQGPRR